MFQQMLFPEQDGMAAAYKTLPLEQLVDGLHQLIVEDLDVVL